MGTARTNQDFYKDSLRAIEQALYGPKTEFPVTVQLGQQAYQFHLWTGQQLPDRLLAYDTETARIQGQEIPQLALAAVYSVPAIACRPKPRGIIEKAATCLRASRVTACLQVQGAIALDYVSRAGVCVDVEYSRQVHDEIAVLVKQHMGDLEKLGGQAMFQRYKKTGDYTTLPWRECSRSCLRRCKCSSPTSQSRPSACWRIAGTRTLTSSQRTGRDALSRAENSLIPKQRSRQGHRRQRPYMA